MGPRGPTHLNNTLPRPPPTPPDGGTDRGSREQKEASRWQETPASSASWVPQPCYPLAPGRRWQQVQGTHEPLCVLASGRAAFTWAAQRLPWGGCPRGGERMKRIRHFPWPPPKPSCCSHTPSLVPRLHPGIRQGSPRGWALRREPISLQQGREVAISTVPFKAPHRGYI